MSTRLQSERPLSIKERLFIDKFIALGAGRGAGKPAALHAGFKPSYAMFAAHRMLRRPSVLRELEARAKARVRALAPKAVDVVEQILDDKEHKDRLRAANQVLNRVDPLLVAVGHQHAVNVTVKSDDQIGLELLRRLRELGAPRDMMERMLGINGLPLLEARLDAGEVPELEPVTIDGEVVAQVEPDDDDGPDWD